MNKEELDSWKKMIENAETIYVSQEDYDTLIENINSPPDPNAVEKLHKLISRKNLGSKK